MSAEFADVLDAVDVALDKGLDDAGVNPDKKTAVKKAVRKETSRQLGIPDNNTTNSLWMILVSTLALVVLGSVVGIGWTVLDASATTQPDVLVTVFTAALTGLIGLFVTPQK